jgi:carbonic anhydrase
MGAKTVITRKEAEFKPMAEDDTAWDYLGLGKNWGWNCYKGLKQSPIDIWARAGGDGYNQNMKINWRAVGKPTVTLKYKMHTLALESDAPFMSAVIHNPRDTISSMQ